MREWWQGRVFPAIGMVLLLAIAGGAWTTSASSLHCQPNQAQNDCHGPYTGEQSPNQALSPFDGVMQWFGSRTDGEITAYATIIIALFTVVLGVGTIFVVLDAREHSRKSLRPYLFNESTGVTDRGTVPNMEKADIIALWGYLAGYISIKNSGQTPAYNVLHWGDIAVWNISNEDALTGLIPTPLDRHSASTIPPGGTNSKLRLIEPQLTPDQILGIRSMTLAIYVFGRIEYDDAFGRHRFSNYRLKFTGQYPPYQNAVLNFCDGGNESDQND